MENLRNFAIGNIEDVLNTQFIERKLTNKLRKQIAGDMAVIASNAFRLGYYAHAKETGIDISDIDFNSAIPDLLAEVTWRIQEAGK